jgi:DNA-binding NarL/FixJ family response regulator
MTIRIVVVDDQALVRAGLQLILQAEDDLDVVTECADGAQAVVAAAGHRPDVVLMDVRMPVLDGIEATRRIRAGGDDAPAVLVLTTFDDDDVLWGAIDAGAAGFVLKDTRADDLVAAVRTTATGGSWLDPRVAPRLLAALRSRAAPRRQAAAVLDRLTERERDVLGLMATGATNGEIAARLHIGERTVKTHVGAIFAKLDVRDRAGAIVAAFDAGLGGAGSEGSSR